MLDAISKPAEGVVQLGLDVHFKAPKTAANAAVRSTAAPAWRLRLGCLPLKLRG
jgi:hypothetical protein